ncbi:MAG: glycosyltransferase family 4 protein, partial [Candidatus Micrarchaeaceae archaeon]
MKILQICFKDPTIYKGGLETVVTELSKKLVYKGNTVDILCTSDKKEGYIKTSDYYNIISLKTPNFNFLGQKGNLIKKIIYNYKLGGYLKKNGKNYNVIHVHGDSGGSKILKKFNTVATFHGFTPFNPSYKNIIKRFFLYVCSARYEFNNLKYSKKNTAVSKKVSNQIQN